MCYKTGVHQCILWICMVSENLNQNEIYVASFNLVFKIWGNGVVQQLGHFISLNFIISSDEIFAQMDIVIYLHAVTNRWFKHGTIKFSNSLWLSCHSLRMHQCHSSRIKKWNYKSHAEHSIFRSCDALTCMEGSQCQLVIANVYGRDCAVCFSCNKMVLSVSGRTLRCAEQSEHYLIHTSWSRQFALEYVSWKKNWAVLFILKECQVY